MSKGYRRLMAFEIQWEARVKFHVFKAISLLPSPMPPLPPTQNTTYPLLPTHLPPSSSPPPPQILQHSAHPPNICKPSATCPTLLQPIHPPPSQIPTTRAMLVIRVRRARLPAGEEALFLLLHLCLLLPLRLRFLGCWFLLRVHWSFVLVSLTRLLKL